MNLNSLINMVVTLFVKRAVGEAVNRGIDYAARRGKQPEDMSEAERAQAASGKAMVGRMRQIRNLTRRFF